MLKEDQRKEFKDKLHNYIDNNCIFRCDPEQSYAPGAPKGVMHGGVARYNTYQFYLRRMTHNPVMMHYTSLLLLDHIAVRHKETGQTPYFQLCGLETGSLPIMAALQHTALAFGLSINAFSIRKERKKYGLFNFIEGIPTEAPVIIVDDLINSGSSVNRCIDVCEYEFGLKVDPQVYSIVTLAKPPFQFKNRNTVYDINSIFVENDFEYEFSKDKYWLPEDCNKRVNKRPDYM